MKGFLFKWAGVLQENEHFRLYEDGKLIQDNIAEPTFSLTMTGKPEKEYSYYVTTFNSVKGLESEPSAPATKVFMMPPAAPTNLSITLF